MKRWKRRALSTVLAVFALTLVWTTPAFARTCNYYYVGETGSSFAVCITKINNGYDAYLEEAAGQGATYLVDFNLETPNGYVGDQGPFYISPGQTKTYFFATGYFDWAYVRVYWRANYSWFPPMDSPVCTTSC